MNVSMLQTPRDADARGAPPESEPASQSTAAPFTHVSAETLLGAILANHQPGTLCVVQFVACGSRAPARAVATAFAAASASRFGRTLAMETDVAASAKTPGGQSPGATDLALRLTTPDVAVPGLTHARIESGSSLMIQALLRDWSNGAGRPFAMVVLDSAAPGANAQALTLARSCTATILVAQAGLSPITALRDTQRRLAAAGAVLPGFIFVRDQAKSPSAHMPRR